MTSETTSQRAAVAHPAADDVAARLQRATGVATEFAGDVVGRSASLAREATYVTIGLTILGCQRAQVRRREIERYFRP